MRRRIALPTPKDFARPHFPHTTGRQCEIRGTCFSRFAKAFWSAYASSRPFSALVIKLYEYA
jgi:hypothetical protein